MGWLVMCSLARGDCPSLSWLSSKAQVGCYGEIGEFNALALYCVVVRR